MKISANVPNLVSGTSNDKHTNEAKKPAVGDSASRSAVAADDSVTLSAAGVDMAKVASSVAQSDGVDRSKVEAIKTALQQGSYPFNPERVAEKMLSVESFFNRS